MASGRSAGTSALASARSMRRARRGRRRSPTRRRSRRAPDRRRRGRSTTSPLVRSGGGLAKPAGGVLEERPAGPRQRAHRTEARRLRQGRRRTPGGVGAELRLRLDDRRRRDARRAPMPPRRRRSRHRRRRRDSTSHRRRRPASRRPRPPRRSLSTELMCRRVARLGGVGVARLDGREDLDVLLPADQPASVDEQREHQLGLAPAAARRPDRGSCCRPPARLPSGTAGGRGRRGRCRRPPWRHAPPRTSDGSLRAARVFVVGRQVGRRTPRARCAVRAARRHRSGSSARHVGATPRHHLHEAGVLERPDRLAHGVP